MTETTKSDAWKWLSLALALLALVLAVALGWESYSLYRAEHPQPPRLGDDPTSPAVPQTAAAHHEAVTDDWAPLIDTTAANDPWEQMNRLQARMNQMFDNAMQRMQPDEASAVNLPSLDIQDARDHYTVRADMPGASKDTIKVNVEGQYLTISGSRSSTSESNDQGEVVRSERSTSQFIRTVELPGPVKPNAVTAQYDNGVLTLMLPKADQASVAGTDVPVR